MYFEFTTKGRDILIKSRDEHIIPLFQVGNIDLFHTLYLSDLFLGNPQILSKSGQTFVLPDIGISLCPYAFATIFGQIF